MGERELALLTPFSYAKSTLLIKTDIWSRNIKSSYYQKDNIYFENLLTIASWLHMMLLSKS